MTELVGDDRHTYKSVPDWANLPPELVLGDVAGIAVDDKDNVYLFNRGNTPVVVLSQSGDVLSTWGQGIFENPHGASIGPDQCIYLTDNFDHTVRKFTLDGKLLLEIGTPAVSSGFMSGKEKQFSRTRLYFYFFWARKLLMRGKFFPAIRLLCSWFKKQ